MIVIKRQLDTEIKQASIEEQGILQGNYSNLQFVLTLANKGEPAIISDVSLLSVYVHCGKNNVNYTIPSTAYSVTNNTVTINATEAMVNYYGSYSLVLQYSTVYTFSIVYNVQLNPVFTPVPISSADYGKYAMVDLSNVADSILKSRGNQSAYLQTTLRTSTHNHSTSLEIIDDELYSAGAYVLAHNLGTKQVGVSVFNITDEAYSPITGINFTAVSENETKVFFAYKPSPNALKIIIHKI